MATTWRPPLPPPDPAIAADDPAADDPRPAGPSSPWRLLAVVAGIVLLGVWAGWWVAAFVVVLLACIFLHELGHYLAARWGGMKATEFFIGFGPRIWSFRRGETEFGLKGIPLGAYVRVLGMNNLEEVPPADEPRTYRQQPFHRRFALAVAGSMMHFAIALALLAVLFAGFDQRRVVGWQVGAVGESSPAAVAGVRASDRIVSVDGVPTPGFAELRAAVAARPGQTVDVVVERDGASVPLTATLESRAAAGGGSSGYLGISAAPVEASDPPFAPHEAVGEAFVEFGTLAGRSVTGLGSVFSPDGIGEYVDTLRGNANTDKRMLSPVGAARVGEVVGEQGFDRFLYLIAAMNIFIGMFNLIPLLPFDGGHAAVAVYERLRSRAGRAYHADIAKLMPLMYGVLLVMGLLFLGNLYLDLFRGLPG